MCVCMCVCVFRPGTGKGSMETHQVWAWYEQCHGSERHPFKECHVPSWSNRIALADGWYMHCFGLGGRGMEGDAKARDEGSRAKDGMDTIQLCYALKHREDAIV